MYGSLVTFEGYWDNQLQMTMFETAIMVVIMWALLLIEMYRTDPRELLHKPTDESPFFVSLFKGDGLGDADSTSAGSQQSADSRRRRIRGNKLKLAAANDEKGRSFWDLTDKKIRHSQLQRVIKLVKSFVDLKLNNGLDMLIE